MKHRYAVGLATSLLAGGLFAQNALTAAEYDALKAQGNLPEHPVLVADPQTHAFKPHLGQAKDGGPCGCWVEPDTTYNVLPPNDDGSSTAIALPFTFSLFGDTYTEVYVNNNGNISFDNPYTIFISSPFPSSNFVMLAPFWADVDTRGDDGQGLNGGQVVYRVTPTALYVNWMGVGYFPSQTDKHNSYQLIITDGSDPAVPAGNNVSFCYKDMQWTSGGNGLNGSPATAGVNRGDGVDHAQVGRFVDDNDSYYGPYADTSGVSWLDSTHFYLNTAGGNLPPIFGSSFNCDTVIVQLMAEGQHSPLHHMLHVLPGGPGKQVSCTASCPTLPALNGWSAGPADFIDVVLDLAGSPAGTHVITFTASNDDGSPTTSSYILQLELVEELSTGLPGSENAFGLQLLPNPAQSDVRLSWTGSNALCSVDILAADGRVIRTVPVTGPGQSIVLNISDLSSGSYLVRAQFNKGASVQRLVKTDR
jgi:Secretion system C-terminal sorting domain